MFHNITSKDKDWELSLSEIGVAYRGNFYVPAFMEEEYRRDDCFINSFYYSLSNNAVYRLYHHRENYASIGDIRTKTLPSKKELMIYKLSNPKTIPPRRRRSFAGHIDAICICRKESTLFKILCYDKYNV